MRINKYITTYSRPTDGAGSDLGGTEVIEDVVDEEAAAFEELAASLDEDDGLSAFDAGETEEPVDETSESVEDVTEAEAETPEAPEQAEEDEPQKPTGEEEAQSTPEVIESTEEVAQAPSLEEYNEKRQTTIDAVEKLYAFDDEEAIDRLRNEPEKEIPKLAAEMFYDIHQAVMQSVHQMFPQMLAQQNTLQQQKQQAEDSFYESWPMLKEAKYSSDYQRIGQMYRQLNPQADQDQFNREVGAQLLIAHKIPFDTRTGKVISEEVVEETPQAPHKPARTSANAPAPAQHQLNQFEEFSQDFDDD